MYLFVWFVGFSANLFSDVRINYCNSIHDWGFQYKHLLLRNTYQNTILLTQLLAINMKKKIGME
ncbi:hypothetical protein PF011_g31749 [Phytophthora fragariae]|uniref:Uncharacterized protein n=1 Tax=Phytophthora fragariae TaxID=53985 RepID=A0A6A3GGI9_9STRA|nr:hypothetical protein PF011_g31749 [Phytophthora fragariae]